MIRKQLGFTLLEIMIALLLGSLVILAATQLFMANQQLFATQQAVSRLMDDGQLMLRYMGNDIRRAGFSGGALSEMDAVVFAGAKASSDGAVSDQLAIQFSGNRDCQGSTSPSPVDIVNVYFVDGGNLRCDGSLTAASVALLTGVEGFRVQYGLDTVKDGEAGPFLFVGAASAAASDRPVVAIRVALLLGTPGNMDANDPRVWDLYDRQISTGADQVVRRVFSSSFMIRNMNWEEI